MTRYDRRSRLLALCLSALAGYVDAAGFIASKGFFVSFMSGNSTRMAVGFVESSVATPIAIAAIIVIFTAGVTVGSVLGNRIRKNRRFTVLGLMTVAILLAAAIGEFGQTFAMIACLAFAMGAANAVFERSGEVGLGVTYMTGSLVRVGHGIAGWLIREAREGWLPYLFLWLSLVGGAVIGAFAYAQLQVASIWLAGGLSALLTVIAVVLPERDISLTL